MTQADDVPERGQPLRLLELEMERHLAHERRRLRLIAVVLTLIAALLAVGHALDHADGTSLLPLGLDDLLAGYPSLLGIGVAAGLQWRRAQRFAAVASGLCVDRH